MRKRSKTVNHDFDTVKSDNMLQEITESVHELNATELKIVERNYNPDPHIIDRVKVLINNHYYEDMVDSSIYQSTKNISDKPSQFKGCSRIE